MTWLIRATDPSWPPGQPFGEGSERWRRAVSVDPNAHSWDDGCSVTPLIGGRAAMDAIREAFEATITDATAGASCHVYLAGWRLNANRDMSATQTAWDSSLTQSQRDATAWGLIRRMMFAGVKVRMLLWLPPQIGPIMLSSFADHIPSHFYLARLMRRGNTEARAALSVPPDGDDLGVVFLDTRVAAEFPVLSSHHQKFIVVRGPNTNVAFCGGVDLAYTRRDAPEHDGDWQSGDFIPGAGEGIKARVNSPLPWELEVSAPEDHQGADLPPSVDVSGIAHTLYGASKQVWHDQHLQLMGPVVSTLEHIFRERWSDPAATYAVLNDNSTDLETDSIISSSELAIEPPSQFTRTYTTDSRVGTAYAPYYIGHGVGEDDIVSVTLAGSVVTDDHYRVGRDGLVFVPTDPSDIYSTSPAFSHPRSGLALSITFRMVRPVALPEPAPVPALIESTENARTKATVQIWLTMPLRGKARGGWEGGNAWARLGENGIDTSMFRSSLTDQHSNAVTPSPYRLGEFSAMAGIANACAEATELIWIFDQYFWSVAYARLLAARLRAVSTLHVLIVLPPWSDQENKYCINIRDSQHTLRWRALKILGDPDIADRVGVFYPWLTTASRDVAVYCHAKTQLFDDRLLVCGSCNLNERSFSVDSEIVCAVESQTVVQDHYLRLWNHFVSPVSAFPSTFSSGWGAGIFSLVGVSLVLSTTKYLRRDTGGHLSNTTTLPTVTRSAPLDAGLLDGAAPTLVNERHGLPLSLYARKNLAEIVDAIERHSPSIRQSWMS